MKTVLDGLGISALVFDVQSDTPKLLLMNAEARTIFSDTASDEHALNSNAIRGLLPHVITCKNRRTKIETDYYHCDDIGNCAYWMALTFNPIIDEETHEVCRVMVVANDMTTHREAGLALELELERYIRMFSVLDAIIVELDAKGVVRIINQSGAKLLGYDAYNMMQSQWVDTVVVSHMRGYVRSALSMMARGYGDALARFEYPLMTKDGRIVDVMWHHVVLTDGLGDTTSILCVGIDITHSKLIHAQQQANHELQAQLRLEEEKRKMRMRFTAMIAHDLKNPLTAATLSLQNLQAFWAHMDEAWREKKFIAITHSLQHMELLIEDMRNYSQLADASVRFEPQVSNFITFCELTVANASTNYSETHTIHCDMNVPELWCEFDTYLMTRLLDNLLNNAVKYSPAGSNVWVKLDYNAAAELLTLSVRDEGIGIPASYLPRVFEPFSRAKNAKDYIGTGLGMVIVQSIARLHGGTVHIESEENVGTTVTLTIKATAAPPRAKRA